MNLKTMAKKAQMQADAWNEKYPEGTKVILTKCDGSKVETKTRSIAWEASCTAIVKVDGIAGGYDLDCIKVIG